MNLTNVVPWTLTLTGFQSLSRDSGRLNLRAVRDLGAICTFQSLSRDSGRLNIFSAQSYFRPGKVSIPQSGFGAFELEGMRFPTRWTDDVSIPQSGFGAFEPQVPSDRQQGPPGVSIPQSGFGAFEHRTITSISATIRQFQSLSRDSGRLNHADADVGRVRAGCFNPSVGIRGV